MNVSVYRRFVTLNNDSKILLRPQAADDLENLKQLFCDAQPEDVMFLKHDVRDCETLKRWCDNIDYARVLPLLAFHGERVVGCASLHFGSDNHRHAAQVRLYIRPEYRNLGLGTRMVKELIELSLKLGIKLVWAEVVVEQSKVMKAFLDMGFSLNAVLPGWFLGTTGTACDVAIMLYGLDRPRPHSF